MSRSPNRLHQWWRVRPAREQQALVLLAVFACISACWLLFISPSKHFLEAQQRRLEDARAMQQALQQGRLAAPQPATDKTLASLLSESAQAHALVLQSLTLQDETRAGMDIPMADFTTFMRWLGELEQQHRLRIERLDVRRLAGGMAEVKLEVSR
jgi:type II secretory pathway component PulM